MSRWSLSRVGADDPALAGSGSPASDDESADVSSRLVQRTAELREARSDQASAWLRLIRAEDRAAALDWQLASIRAHRSYRLFRVLRQARSARALLRMPLDGLRVLTTAAPPPPRPPDPGLRGRAAHTQDGWEAYDRRDYETALAEASAVLDGHPKDYAALDLQQSAHWQRGDIARTVSAVSQMRLVHDSPEVARRERTIVGYARELDPRWRPRVPGPPRPAEPRDGVIMHLLQESVPYQASGFAVRGRDTAASQRRAGLDPFVVTSLGFPRRSGVTSFRPVEVIDGTPYHRLDAGPDYPRHQADDVVLGDTAWMAGRIGRERRPSVIHAMTGPRGFETALVGLALREHLDRPLVYDVGAFDGTTWADDTGRARRGEHHEAYRAAETRCLRTADLVVTTAEGMRSEIIARGIPEHQVVVVPDGVDADRFVPGQPSAALRGRYGLDGRIVIGYLSTGDYQDADHEILIEATARLRAGGRDVVGLVAGDGPAAAGPVIFTGRIPAEQARDYYLLMDVFVVPRADQCAARMAASLTLLRAMAMGLPLIVPDLPALTGLAKPGERGLAFTAGDPAALGRAIEALLDNPRLARRLADEGRRWILAERSWAANGQRYRDIYGQLLDRWATGGRAAAGPS